MTRLQRLEKLLERIANEPDTCVLCGWDTRQVYDCKCCGIDHLDGFCRRKGEHAPDCPLKEFETVTRTERIEEKQG